MKNSWKWILGVLALVALIGGASLLYNKLSDGFSPGLVSDVPAESAAPEETASESETQKQTLYAAPDFTVTDYSGNPVSLSDMQGKPVVINFWASWCPPCKAEMPDFEAVYKERGEEITFMMVNMTDGSRETVALAKAHAEENGYTFPVYFDTASEAAYAYGVSSIPATYFVDADGNLIAHATGQINAQTLVRGIEMITQIP